MVLLLLLAVIVVVPVALALAANGVVAGLFLVLLLFLAVHRVPVGVALLAPAGLGERRRADVARGDEVRLRPRRVG